ELAQATGATVHLSGEGGADWQYGFDGRRLHDGDTIEIGNLTIAVDHTPGHTPEHLSLKLTDGAAADEPGYLFTGDFVFVGDLGRPDLLDEAAGGVDTRYEGAKQMFASLRDKLLALPDYVQIYPAHGSGSACGKALGAVPTTTVGYERNFSWWSHNVANDDEQGFIDEPLAGQPDAPAYFGRMKRQNRDGPAILGHRDRLPELDAGDVKKDIDDGSVVFVDPPSPLSGWAYEPLAHQLPPFLLYDVRVLAQMLLHHLIWVCSDYVSWFVTYLDGMPSVVPERASP